MQEWKYFASSDEGRQKSLASNAIQRLIILASSQYPMACKMFRSFRFIFKLARYEPISDDRLPASWLASLLILEQTIARIVQIHLDSQLKSCFQLNWIFHAYPYAFKLLALSANMIKYIGNISRANICYCSNANIEHKHIERLSEFLHKTWKKIPFVASDFSFEFGFGFDSTSDITTTSIATIRDSSSLWSDFMHKFDYTTG